MVSTALIVVVVVLLLIGAFLVMNSGPKPTATGTQSGTQQGSPQDTPSGGNDNFVFYKACQSKTLPLLLKIVASGDAPQFIKVDGKCYTMAPLAKVGPLIDEWVDAPECAANCSAASVPDDGGGDGTASDGSVSDAGGSPSASGYLIFCKMEIPFRVTWKELPEEPNVEGWVPLQKWFAEGESSIRYREESPTMAQYLPIRGSSVWEYSKATDKTVYYGYDLGEGYCVKREWDGFWGDGDSTWGLIDYRLPLDYPLFGDDGQNICPEGVYYELKRTGQKYPCTPWNTLEQDWPAGYKEDIWGYGYYSKRTKGSVTYESDPADVIVDFTQKRTLNGLDCYTTGTTSDPCVNQDYCINLGFCCDFPEGPFLTDNFGVTDLGVDFSDSVFDIPSICTNPSECTHPYCDI